MNSWLWIPVKVTAALVVLGIEVELVLATDNLWVFLACVAVNLSATIIAIKMWEAEYG